MPGPSSRRRAWGITSQQPMAPTMDTITAVTSAAQLISSNWVRRTGMRSDAAESAEGEGIQGTAMPQAHQQPEQYNWRPATKASVHHWEFAQQANRCRCFGVAVLE